MKMTSCVLSLLSSLFIFSPAAKAGNLSDEKTINEKLNLLPEIITVTEGDVKLEIQKKSYWNISSVYYKENCLAAATGWYGTVIGFNKTGWVGSGHMENRIGEKIQSLEFYIDGKKIPLEKLTEQSKFNCKSFTLKKISSLMDIRLEYELTLENNVLSEKSRITMLKKCSIGIIYNFMHCWHSDFTDYVLAGSEIQNSAFTENDKNKSFIMERPHYGVLFNRNSKYGIVSAVGKNSGEKTFFRLWSRLPGYRKLYLGMNGSKLKMAETENFAMRTSFFQSASENWREEAEKLAGKINGMAE